MLLFRNDEKAAFTYHGQPFFTREQVVQFVRGEKPAQMVEVDIRSSEQHVTRWYKPYRVDLDKGSIYLSSRWLKLTPAFVAYLAEELKLTRGAHTISIRIKNNG